MYQYQNVLYVDDCLETEADGEHSLEVIATNRGGLKVGIIEGVEIGSLLAAKQGCISIEGVATVAQAAGEVGGGTEITICGIGLHGIDGYHLPGIVAIATGLIVIAKAGVVRAGKHLLGIHAQGVLTGEVDCSVIVHCLVDFSPYARRPKGC